jgi:hypothetical protein
VFEDLSDWQVHAVRGGIIRTTGFFPQTYPADAVTVLAACVRRKFGSGDWPEWAFHCIARDGVGRPLRTLVYAIRDAGIPVCVVDSGRDGTVGSKSPFTLQGKTRGLT